MKSFKSYLHKIGFSECSSAGKCKKWAMASVYVSFGICVSTVCSIFGFFFLKTESAGEQAQIFLYPSFGVLMLSWYFTYFRSRQTYASFLREVDEMIQRSKCCLFSNWNIQCQFDHFRSRDSIDQRNLSKNHLSNRNAYEGFVCTCSPNIVATFHSFDNRTHDL